MRMVFVLAMRVASYWCVARVEAGPREGRERRAVQRALDLLLDEESVEQRPDRRGALGRDTRTAGLEPERHLDVPGAAHRGEARVLGIGCCSGPWCGAGRGHDAEGADDDKRGNQAGTVWRSSNRPLPEMLTSDCSMITVCSPFPLSSNFRVRGLPCGCCSSQLSGSSCRTASS